MGFAHNKRAPKRKIGRPEPCQEGEPDSQGPETAPPCPTALTPPASTDPPAVSGGAIAGPSRTPFSDALRALSQPSPQEAVWTEAAGRVASQAAAMGGDAEAVTLALFRALNGRSGTPLPMPGHALPLIL